MFGLKTYRMSHTVLEFQNFDVGIAKLDLPDVPHAHTSVALLEFRNFHVNSKTMSLINHYKQHVSINTHAWS